MGVPMGEGAVEATRGTKRQAGDGRVIAPMSAIAKVARFIIAKHHQNLPSKSVRRILPGHTRYRKSDAYAGTLAQYFQLSMRFVENHIDSGALTEAEVC
jgi:hypothetical protein